jgi:hypothetical protein
MSIKWQDGGQQFDAELIQRGEYIQENFYPEHSYLEVTCAMHKNEYLQRELLETQGGGFGLDGMKHLVGGEIESKPVSYCNGDFIVAYSKIVKRRIADKSKKPYPAGTTLLVQCSLNMPYMPNEWDELMALVGAEIPPSTFREIFLYDTVCQYKKSFFPQRSVT